MSDIDDESDNHDETNAFTCDDIDDDESDKSLRIKRVASKNCYLFFLFALQSQCFILMLENYRC